METETGAGVDKVREELTVTPLLLLLLPNIIIITFLLLKKTTA